MAFYRRCSDIVQGSDLSIVKSYQVISQLVSRVEADFAPPCPFFSWFQQAMVHFDGTARHQSVGATDEPWLHQLLLAVSKHTKLAALINTSFNTRGREESKIHKILSKIPKIFQDSRPTFHHIFFLNEGFPMSLPPVSVQRAAYGEARVMDRLSLAPGKPIVNSIKESLVMLDTLPDLDYLLIEDTTAGDVSGTGLV